MRSLTCAAARDSSRDGAPGPAPSRGRPDTRAIYRSTAASYASLLLLIAADPPDDTGLRDLDERAVVSAGRVRGHAVFRRATEPRARIALAEVAHRAVIDEVERAIGSEHRRVRPVDPAQRRRLDERLVVRDLAAGRPVWIVELIRLLAVEREPRLLEAEALALAAEVHQL